MKSDNEEVKPVSSFVVSEIKERLIDQISSIHRLDNKAALTLSFIGALIAGLSSSDWFISRSIYYQAPTLLLLLGSVVCALIALLVRKYSRDPMPRRLLLKYGESIEYKVQNQLAYNWVACYEKNQPLLNRKSTYVNLAFVLLAAGITLLCISIVMTDSVIIIESERIK